MEILSKEVTFRLRTGEISYMKNAGKGVVGKRKKHMRGTVLAPSHERWPLWPV